MEENDVDVSEVKYKYFEMCEIIINNTESKVYEEGKSEYLKFLERDYQDIILVKSKIEEETGFIMNDDDIKNYI